MRERGTGCDPVHAVHCTSSGGYSIYVAAGPKRRLRVLSDGLYAIPAPVPRQRNAHWAKPARFSIAKPAFPIPAAGDTDYPAVNPTGYASVRRILTGVLPLFNIDSPPACTGTLRAGYNARRPGRRGSAEDVIGWSHELAGDETVPPAVTGPAHSRIDALVAVIVVVVRRVLFNVFAACLGHVAVPLAACPVPLPA